MGILCADTSCIGYRFTIGLANRCLPRAPPRDGVARRGGFRMVRGQRPRIEPRRWKPASRGLRCRSSRWASFSAAATAAARPNARLRWAWTLASLQLTTVNNSGQRHFKRGRSPRLRVLYGCAVVWLQAAVKIVRVAAQSPMGRIGGVTGVSR